MGAVTKLGIKYPIKLTWNPTGHPKHTAASYKGVWGRIRLKRFVVQHFRRFRFQGLCKLLFHSSGFVQPSLKVRVCRFDIWHIGGLYSRGIQGLYGGDIGTENGSYYSEAM